MDGLQVNFSPIQTIHLTNFSEECLALKVTITSFGN